MLRGDNSERYAWVVGAGLPSLAATVFMIRDAKMKGENIQIFEDSGPGKNTLDTFSTKLPNEPSPVFLNLLTDIPFLNSQDISIRKQLEDFPEQTKLKDIILSIRYWLQKEGVIFSSGYIGNEYKS
ncbi:MAG: oleate hydratase [Tannerellaceae bacterium]|nr:oleate hydratase [Tannerellaceae bacterium]